MKNLTFLSLLILFIILFLPGNSFSQNKFQGKTSSTWWIGIETGKAFNHIDGKRLSGRLNSINFNYNSGIHLFTIQGSGTSTQHKSNGRSGAFIFANIVSHLFTGEGVKAPPPVYIKSKYSSGSLMYGLISKPATFRFFASSGVSWVSGHGNYKSDNFSEIGIPIKCGILISTKTLGLGVNYFQNFNSYSNYSGLAISMHIGVNK